jgi:hypothetical protein
MAGGRRILLLKECCLDEPVHPCGSTGLCSEDPEKCIFFTGGLRWPSPKPSSHTACSRILLWSGVVRVFLEGEYSCLSEVPKSDLEVEEEGFLSRDVFNRGRLRVLLR